MLLSHQAQFAVWSITCGNIFLSRDIAKNNGFIKFGGLNFGELLLNSPNSPMFSVANVFHYTVYKSMITNL